MASRFRQRMGRHAGWMPMLGLLLVLIGTWLALEFANERAYDLSVHRPTAFIPPRNDFALILQSVRELIAGQQASPNELYYPAPTVATFTLLGLVPNWLAVAVARIGAVALTVGAVVAWCSRKGAREGWLWAEVVGPAVISLIRLDQFDTAVAFAALTGAALAQRRSRWWLCGLLLGIAACRPNNAIPLAIGILIITFRTSPRGALRVAIAGGLWFALIGLAGTRWDTAWLAHLITLPQRINLVGLPAIAATVLGHNAPVALLSLTVGLAVIVGVRARHGPISLDAAASLLALSLIPTLLGGPYVAVFALPGVVRLASRHGGAVAWGTSIGFAALLILGAVLPGSLGQAALDLVVIAPLALAALSILLASPAHRAGAQRRRSASVRSGRQASSTS